MASGVNLRQIGGVDGLNENFLWASLVWGAVGGGYLVYGWRQKAAIPLAAGAALTALSFAAPNAWVMSCACLAIMFAAWWLRQRGW